LLTNAARAASPRVKQMGSGESVVSMEGNRSNRPGTVNGNGNETPAFVAQETPLEADHGTLLSMSLRWFVPGSHQPAPLEAGAMECDHCEDQLVIIGKEHAKGFRFRFCDNCKSGRDLQVAFFRGEVGFAYKGKEVWMGPEIEVPPVLGDPF
jgi:hypothetical protein